ncbi:MAG: DNA polymerase III subunit gamma/tau [Kangiellaceae bacterium]|nr:DNA polymerase III subunit gamma/tau [Kangiellaceae bacterium]
MSYQVLARKWRPKSFEELVGQEQTAKALINALESQRLHHAYLFTGTRGVGKTTIARILSKSLNCEIGITSKPCGECSSCTEIDQGNFVDLMEIDAASRTKVEDTRELLDNVQYRPTRGRYKVYLIDEVHMLSGHSFNALLKTLEEPPPHVVFLLATTDPQKLPVTVLSRCLQFHLKRMEQDQIVAHLSMILQAEAIEFEPKALLPIAKGADGSMRDGLSLLDQAIAFSGGKIELEHALEMLGSIDQSFCYQLLDAVCKGDASALMSVIQDMSQYSPDYFEVMSDWLSLLHAIAVAQATLNDEDEKISELAENIFPADLQLFYQLSLQAKKDMAFAPHPRQGFEMALLRVIAFRPAKLISTPQSQEQALGQKKKIIQAESQKTSGIENNFNTAQNNEDAASSAASSIKEPGKNQLRERLDVVEEPKKQIGELDTSTPNDSELTSNPWQSNSKGNIGLEQVVEGNWHLSLGQMNLDGNGLQILLNALAHFENGVLIITLLKAVEHFLTDNLKMSISENLSKHYQTKNLKIDFVIAKELAQTPKQKQMESYQLAMEQGHNNLINDPCVMRLAEGAGVTIDKSSMVFDDKASIIALV